MDKLKAWYKEHKIEISNGAKIGFYFAVIITIPCIAIIFALFNGTDKTLPSQGLFTGFIAYCGIIISFWGVYWKTNREEEKAKKEKEEREIREMEAINSYIKYIVDKNRDFFNNGNKNDFSMDGFARRFLDIKKDNEGNLPSLFYFFDEGYISKNIENILKLKCGIEVLSLEREIKIVKEEYLESLSKIHPINFRNRIITAAKNNNGTKEEQLNFLVGFHTCITNICNYSSLTDFNNEAIKNMLGISSNLQLDEKYANEISLIFRDVEENYKNHKSGLDLVNIYVVNMLHLNTKMYEVIPWKLKVAEELLNTSKEIQSEIASVKNTIKSAEKIMNLIRQIDKNLLVCKQEDF